MAQTQPPEPIRDPANVARIARERAEQTTRRARREALTVAWRSAKSTGVFGAQMSNREVRRNLERMILDGDLWQAAILRELLRLRHLHSRRARAQSVVKRAAERIVRALGRGRQRE